MREQEQEKQWDELFNEMKPIVLQKQEWRHRKVEHSSLEAGGQTAEVLVGPPRKSEVQNLFRQEASGPIATPDS